MEDQSIDPIVGHKTFRDSNGVRHELLRECDAVLAIVEPENDDEAQDLARLRQHIRMATGEEKGTLL